MGQGDNTTKEGSGQGAAPRGDSEVPMSRLRESVADVAVPRSSRRNMSTQPGMPKDDKKVVTNRGMVAPPPLAELSDEEQRALTGGEPSGQSADKTTNPRGMTAPPALEDLQLDEVEMPAESRRYLERLQTHPEHDADQGECARRVAGAEDITPAEGTDLNSSNQESDNDRSRFRTAPGGGRNRVSGGREHAAAYVSPSTLPPGHGSDHVTSAIKVHEIVEKAARAYQTEPSLLRRRASSLPPPLPYDYDRRPYLLWAAVVIGLLLAAGLVWIAVVHRPVAARKAPMEEPSGAGAVVQAKPASVGIQQVRELRNPPPLKLEKEAGPSPAPSASAPSASAPSASAPSASAPSASAPSATTPAAPRIDPSAGARPARKTPAEPSKNDLWLE